MPQQCTRLLSILSSLENLRRQAQERDLADLAESIGAALIAAEELARPVLKKYLVDAKRESGATGAAPAREMANVGLVDVFGESSSFGLIH